MHIKRTAAAILVTGATAGVLFGGSTVSTAFTSSSGPQIDRVVAAKTGVSVQNGSFTLTNLVPGAAASGAGPVVITNNSTVPAVATVTFSKAQVNKNGNDNGVSVAPDFDKLIVKLGGQRLPASAFRNGGGPVSIGTLAEGQSVSVPVTVQLAEGTGNSWNGADVQMSYTVTMTAGK